MFADMIDDAFAKGRSECNETRELLRRVVMDFAPDCSPGCGCSAKQARQHLAALNEKDPT